MDRVESETGTEPESRTSEARNYPEPGTHYGPGAIVTVANIITFGRAAALPLLFYLMLQSGTAADWAAFGLWVLLGISDTLDGIAARRLGPTTSGAYLDPLADKLQVLGALVILWMQAAVSWVPVAAIAAREAGVSGLRSIAARRGVSIPATPFGKVKTLTQMIAIGMFLFPPLSSRPGPGTIALWIAVGFTLASGLDYAWRGVKILTKPAAESPPPDSGSLDAALEPVISAILDREQPKAREGSKDAAGGISSEESKGGLRGSTIIPLRPREGDGSL